MSIEYRKCFQSCGTSHRRSYAKPESIRSFYFTVQYRKLRSKSIANSQEIKICTFLEKLLRMPKVLWNPLKMIVIVCATQHAKHAGSRNHLQQLGRSAQSSSATLIQSLANKTTPNPPASAPHVLALVASRRGRRRGLRCSCAGRTYGLTGLGNR
jgi:hypothetical protein